MHDTAIKFGDVLFQTLFDARRQVLDLDDREVLFEVAVKRNRRFLSVPKDPDVMAAGRPGDFVGQTLDFVNELTFAGGDIEAVPDPGSPRLQMDINLVDPRHVLAQVALDVSGHLM